MLPLATKLNLIFINASRVVYVYAPFTLSTSDHYYHVCICAKGYVFGCCCCCCCCCVCVVCPKCLFTSLPVVKCLCEKDTYCSFIYHLICHQRCLLQMYCCVIQRASFASFLFIQLSPGGLWNLSKHYSKNLIVTPTVY